MMIIKQCCLFVIILFGLMSVPCSANEKGDEQKAFHKGQIEKRKALHEDIKVENKEFRESLKGLKSEEKSQAMIKHREEQFAKRKELNEKIYQENKSFLMERLSKNKKLTDAEKNELVGIFERQHGENTSFREQQHKENIDFFSQIANDSNLTPEEKKQKIKEHHQEQKKENAAHREEQKSERKEKHQERKKSASKNVK